MGSRRIRLGILDFGELAMRDVVACARAAEELGFSRYWLAEHAGLVTNALLASAVVASATSRIRVGPAGVLLRYYPAASVARDGLFLARAFGRRIDLGLAAGRHREDADYLDRRTHLYEPATLEEKIRGVAEKVAAHQPARERPDLWLLGASDSPDRARSAARLGANFCLSLIHTETPPSPLAIRAHRAEARRLRRAPGRTGVLIMLACVASARARERTRRRSPHVGMLGPVIVEDAANCRRKIEEIARGYDVDEVTILECSHGVRQRLASLTRLAEAFDGRL